jgi:zinc/manganese transport system ATP-binding protein
VDARVNDAANVVECQNVTLALGGRTVLDDVSLSIAAGEFVGVLGPNGAGKTTLLRAILGLVPPVAGRIAVLGAPAARGNSAIGYMPQTRVAPGGLRISGHDFVAAVVRGHRPGLPHLDAAGRREVGWALEMVEATALARRPLGEMSGGERQRLLLAQALVGHPRLLLLDEPLISLDPTRQIGVVALVRRVQKELGLAVLFSAHEINPLLGALDRVLYLGGGHAAIGHVDEVITSAVLSRLYGTAIDVVRLGGRIFVLAGPYDVESDAHRHDDEGGHAHGHHAHEAHVH